MWTVFRKVVRCRLRFGATQACIRSHADTLLILLRLVFILSPGLTPLGVAVRSGNVEIVRHLIEVGGADVNDRFGNFTPLILAVRTHGYCCRKRMACCLYYYHACVRR